MNKKDKKRIIVITLLFIILVIGIVGLFYLASFKSVFFNISKNDTGITIYHENEEIKTIQESQSIRLKKGTYTVRTTNSKYDNSEISVTIKGSTTQINIVPMLSQAYQNEIIKKEIKSINKVISIAYPKTLKNFTIDTGRIYDEEQWYATTLTHKSPNPSELGDTYKVVLKKINNEWVLQTKPSLYLNKYDYPDIPFEILSNINTQYGSYL